MPKILIADDSELRRRSLKDIFSNHDGWNVCGEARQRLSGRIVDHQLKPDVINLDIAMPMQNGGLSAGCPDETTMWTLAQSAFVTRMRPFLSAFFLALADLLPPIQDLLFIAFPGWPLRSLRAPARPLLPGLITIKRRL